MCYRPITIRNPKLVKNNVYDRALIEVPCGKCVACKQEKQYSWFVRLYYEWLYCITMGGFAYFLTLTYDEDSIPRFFPNFDFKELKKLGFRHTQGIRCFSKRDIQLYLKRIRKRLSKDYPHYDLSGKLKYMITMELGSETHRPHYHVVFFISSPFIRSWHFRNIVKELWCKDVNNISHKGFVKEGKLNNGFVVSPAALSYCAKYVTKDLNDEEYTRIMIGILKKNGVSDEMIRSSFPHHMQSQGLGIYALECDEFNDLDTFMNGQICIPDADMSVRSYKLPLFFERKLFYNIKYRFFDTNINEYIVCDSLDSVPKYFAYSPIYVLNDLGLEMKEKRLEKVLQSTVNVYRVVTSVPDDIDIITKVNEKFKVNFDSLSSLQQVIKENLPEEAFLAYSLVYRGCVSVPDYLLPEHFNVDARIDYMLIHYMSSGYIPTQDEFGAFCENVDIYSQFHLIEDYYNIIRYIFKLLSLDVELQLLHREKYYCQQKSYFLRITENIV